MRARYPDVAGFVEVRGVKVGYEVYGSAARTVVLTQIDPIVQSRAWKAQIAFLARHARVVTIDPRGNGRSDRVEEPTRELDTDLSDDVIAVMDAVGVDRALLVGLCTSGWVSLLTAARVPERVAGVVSLGTWAPYLTPPLPHKADLDWDNPRETYEGWQRVNRHYMLANWPEYVDWFFHQLLPEPYSTKQHEDCVGWALDAGPRVVVAADASDLSVPDRDAAVAILQRVTCPVLTIHGSLDACQPTSRSEVVAEITGGRYVGIEGAGHVAQARHPVVVNRMLLEFLDEVLPPPTTVQGPSLPPEKVWSAVAERPVRALFLSSPIGLGHARRDLAIAQELRALRPEVEIDWLTQHPVTTVLEGAGERVHEASALLANESAHVESECGEHDLHAFQAIRRMDEILVSNFMVYADVVEREGYDLVVADEAWDVDHFLHENPELKRGALAWLTDFVGWVPFEDGGPREAYLTRDYNAEMVSLVARSPWVRDRSLFVGDLDDVVPLGLGEALPSIRDWTAEHFDFCGYVTGYPPVADADRAGLRASLGYRDDERVCLVTVGGSGVGLDLLRRVAASFGEAARVVPGLRMVVVAGPRIDPAAVGAPEGVEVRGYVPDLWQHLAVCDVAVVQGGLTTTMELVANRRPFLYVPLRHHFEQRFHVRHRLDRHGAGVLMEYADLAPDVLADAIATTIDSPADYLPVPTDGAARVARHLAALL